MIAGLTLAILVLSVRLLAVRVELPVVLKVMLKVFVPLTSAVFAGSAALPSEEVMPMVSLMLVTTFQLGSTALTVTLKAVPAVWAVGVPVLPVVVPGAVASPGTRSWSLVNAAALTGMAELILAVFVPSVASVEVTVGLPAVFRVTLKLWLPATNAALAGKLAFASEDVMATVSVALVIGFQLASTALTVTLKAAPAV